MKQTLFRISTACTMLLTLSSCAGNTLLSAQPRLSESLQLAYKGQQCGAVQNIPSSFEADEEWVASVNKGIYEDQGVSFFESVFVINELPDMKHHTQSMMDKLVASARSTLGAEAVPEKVLVLFEASPSNAQAFPEYQLVLISDMMLRRIKSEEELAALLSHELAHVILKHGGRTSFMGSANSALTWATHAGIGYSRVASAKRDPDSGELNVDEEQAKALKKVAVSGKIAADMMARKLIDNSWSNGQEQQADRLAADLMVCAGYDPRTGFSHLGESLKAWSTANGDHFKAYAKRFKKINEEPIDYFYKGMESIKGQIIPLGLGVGGSPDTASAAIQEDIASYATPDKGKTLDLTLKNSLAVISTLTDMASPPSHPEIEERIEQVNQHLDEHYADATWTQKKQKSFKRAFLTQSSRNAYKTFDAARSVKQDMFDNNFTTTSDAGTLRSTTRSAIFPRKVMGDLRFSQEKDYSALVNYRGISGSPFAPLEVLKNKAAIHILRNEMSSADNVIARMEKLYHPNQLYGAKIQLATLKNDTERVATLLDECDKEAGILGISLRKSCQKAAGSRDTSFLGTGLFRGSECAESEDAKACAPSTTQTIINSIPSLPF